MNFKILLASLLGVICITTSATAAECDTTNAPKKMVITLHSHNISSAGFGLAVANAMQDAGVQSTVFVAADAVDYALTNTKQGKFGASMPKDMISSLIKKGGKVMICEGFVKARGINKSEMVKGIEVATPGDLAGALFAPNAQSMTF